MTDSPTGPFSNRLNLDRFFFEVREQIYVIVKGGDFPDYYKGSDIDVFCYNKDEFARRILAVGNKYLHQGFEIRVHDQDQSHTHVDFLLDGELEFRFDLYQSLPKYRKVRLKEHYLYSVIENARTLYRESDGVEYPFYVPSTTDDLLLRYVEYIEWYELRPDKVKHLDYIVGAIDCDPGRISFLDKLHAYTELPSPDFGHDSHARASAFARLPSWIGRIRSIGLRRLPAAIYRKVRRIVLALSRRLGRTKKSGSEHATGRGRH